MARPEAAVVDASVAAKWFLPEAGSDAALAMRDAHVDGRIRLVAPAFLFYEVANALRYHPRVGSDLLSEHVEDLFSLEIGIDAPSETSMVSAVRVAFRTGLTVYDAAYIALAERLDCILYTADETQIGAARSRARPISEWSGTR